jgi:DTW domain-containing protein YfiP
LELSPRPTCPRCRRPTSACYCAAVPHLPTRTRVVILQHPRERDVAIGTARMVRLALPSAQLHVGVQWTDASLFGDDPARPPILLYPGRGARNILVDPPTTPVTLVVVDGTWSQAKSVVRDNPLLAALPRYGFVAPEPSQYRIRREPDVAYVSTIEAVMHVLGALEGDPARFRALLEPLRAMVDHQLVCQATRPHRRVRQPRMRPPRPRIPPALVDRHADLVAIVAEANAWPYGSVGPRRPDELVHVVAERVATGERFAAIAAPSELAPATAFHTELAEAVLRAAGTRDAALAGLAAFVRPSDIACAWGCYTFDLVRHVLPRALLDLRAIVRHASRDRVGSLEDHAASLGAPTVECDPGRAPRRLAQLVATIRQLRADAAAVG